MVIQTDRRMDGQTDRMWFYIIRLSCHMYIGDRYADF